LNVGPGARLGPYEVLAPLGAGGMGEVFRARDPRLGRDVAIKALPDAFASDPERLARFEREARLLASLNHSNLASIHGIEEVEGRRYLVLEYVDGETLAAKLARGALPVDEAVEVCREIAAGVEAAHESGVVHRDLKPGNVMVMPDGRVKVLDFGLATSGGGGASGSDPNLSHSPTLTQATRAGVILGTAAYMSPEQARGRAVDKRTDIWSFGCVLFECLTGRALFQGETVSDLIARILEREPDWSALPANTPPRVRELLQRCLRKDPRERLRDIGDARLELAEAHGFAAAPAQAAAASGRLGWLPWVLLGVVAIASSAFVLMRAAPKASVDKAPPMRVSIPLPQGLEVSQEVPDVTLSPDGRTIVFAASDSSGVKRLYVRPLQSASLRALPGTEGAVIPFWSPDSRRIGFFSGGNLMRTSLDDGARPQVLCAAANPRGGAWSPRDVIVFAPAASGPMLQVPASGGKPTPATTLDASRGETAHRFPQFLPDGEHFVYVAIPGKDNKLDTRVGTPGSEPGPVILTSPGVATYAAPGFLVFNQNESVVAQAFDPAALKLTGAPQVIRDFYNVAGSYSGSPMVMASRDGALIQREFRTTGMRLVLMDRKGVVIRPLRLPEGRYFGASFSPDGSRMAVTYARLDEPVDKVWMVDVARNVSTRFSFNNYYDSRPQWTPDGRRVVWGSDTDAGREIFWKSADGSGEEELLADVPNLFNDPTSVTDGEVVYRSLSGETSEDIWVVPLTGERKPRPLIRTPFNELDAVVSPDGRWMAYRGDESGRFEIYVVAFPSMDRRLRVSSDGAAPGNASLVVLQWRSDGRELYYVAGDGRTLMAAPVESGDEFRAGTPMPMFRFARETAYADITGDGRTIVAVVPASQESRSILNLVFNWADEVEDRP
jgi:eukaryotic-like serine/threonine-protein kinase